jgi:hypothetical protein
MAQPLEYDRRVQSSQSRPAQVRVDGDRGEAELGRLAHGLDRKDLGLVPMGRVRRELRRRKAAGGVLDGALIVAKSEIHPAARFT